ncbi:MAG: hypothetical protein K6F56_10340 [Oscillospiraceae bacterium]|nr:hypothetical protein [Oscillospiraceae bacterium]
MSVSGKNDKSYSECRAASWYVTAAFCCVFWPVGLALLIINTRREEKRQAGAVPAVLYSARAVLLYSLFDLWFWFRIFKDAAEGAELPMFCLIILPPLLLALTLYLLNRRFAGRARNMERCRRLVLQEHITGLDSLSEILGLSAERMTALLERMIREGILEDAWIDADSRELRFRSCPWAHQKMICDSCGAELTVNLGQTLVCEYCGSALRSCSRRHSRTEREV